MRYISKLYQPLIFEPQGAKIINSKITCRSQKLLVDNGLVRPTSDGLFALLPLGRRALDKLENLIHNQMDKIGAQKISLPSLTSLQLWETSDRLKNAGPELLQVEDRHKKRYLLAPTHEETIAHLLSEKPLLSHKQLPLLLYQISNKYRDENRPKHGLLRAREFGMFDAYSFHADPMSVLATYEKVTTAYKDLFEALNLRVHRVEASNGDMGGTLSHEWQLLAAVGEDSIQMCRSCSHVGLAKETECLKCGKMAEVEKSIEVGHTFVLGSRYSEPLKANFLNHMGSPAPLLMACYGIGTTRLLAASIEALSSDKSIRWPRAVAPYSVIVIGPKQGSKEWKTFGFEKVQEVSRAISEAGFDVIIDDRHTFTIGKRYNMAENMGYPHVVICGRDVLESPPRFELHQLYAGNGSNASKPHLLTFSELVTTLTEKDKHDEENLRIVTAAN